MKKTIILSLCAAALLPAMAQKATVDQAKKLAGKIDKIEEARALIHQASQDPETSASAETYYTGGKVEFGAFETAALKRSVNPNDPAVNLQEMCNELINGYNCFLKAFPLDSVPNDKGQVKPKHSKEMAGKINAHHQDYYNFAGEMFNAKHYFPESYSAFMIYGDIADQPWADKAIKALPDTALALAYHYAGICGYSSDKLPEALEAFSKARMKGITDPNNYVYEIACWQNLALRDSTLEDVAKKGILAVAQDGYDRFGITNPLFINNLVNSMIQQSKFDDAIALISGQINKTPDQPFLYGLRAFVKDRADKDDAAVADYIKAASFDNADVETLTNASKKLYTTAVRMWNEIEGPEKARRAEVKNEYLLPAKAIAQRASEKDPGNPTVDYVLENINYALESWTF